MPANINVEPHPFAAPAVLSAVMDASDRHKIIEVEEEDKTQKTEDNVYEKFLKHLNEDESCQKDYAAGRRIAFYKVGKELGAGNFSKVKLGMHALTKEKVALKVVEKSKLDPKAQKLLIREIDNMQFVHHPNIIQLFEVVENLSRMHLVMEFADGGELYKHVIENGTLAEDVAKPIFAQIVAAVDCLHSNEIIHRDIKAENVFMVNAAQVKLGDFGFSIHLNEVNQPLATFCGSPPYAAPELFRDSNYNGPLVDIWALGVLLYFILTGTTPFRGDTVAELKSRILESVYEIPNTVSTQAQTLIRCLCQPDIAQRSGISDIKSHAWLSGQIFPPSFIVTRVATFKPDDQHSVDVNKDTADKLRDNFGIKYSQLSSALASKDTIRSPLVGIYRIVEHQLMTQAEKKGLKEPAKTPERRKSKNKDTTIKKNDVKENFKAVGKTVMRYKTASKFCTLL